MGSGKEKEIAEMPSYRKMIFIKNEKNNGFVVGNNIGMRYALSIFNPDYIMFHILFVNVAKNQNYMDSEWQKLRNI